MTEQPPYDTLQTIAAGRTRALEHPLASSDWRVFAEAGTAGNSARVYISSQPVPTPRRQQLAAAQPHTTHCFSWPETPKTHSYRVYCHNSQAEIQRCGHGYLAMAGALLATGIAPPLRLLAADDTAIPVTSIGIETAAKATPSTAMATTTANSAVSPLWEIHLPRLHCQEAELPPWARQAFEPAPSAAATAGGDNGYWIFEWDTDSDLARLIPHSEVISQHSQRAVIATQATSAHDAHYPFQLRYFAPQYGIVEDAVTGSANAVLADYWAGRLGRSQFRALQCSANGGVVYSRLTDTSVAISGKVERL